MEIQIAVEELNRALYRAQGIVEKKSTLPILSNVLLEATKEKGLTVTAFDLEIGITSEHQAEVQKEGRVAIAARHLYDIVRSLPEPTLILRQVSEGYVELICGTSHFRIVANAADDFPTLPTHGELPFVSVEPKQLLEMIERTSFAISSDETRHNLSGVFFQPVESGVRMVATDGHRLTLAEKEMAAAFQLERGVIIPRKGVQELRRLLGEAGSQAELGFTEKAGVFRRPGLTLIMQLVAGEFPAYEQVIPKEHSLRLRLPRVRFQDALKRVSLLSQDQMYTVKLEVEEGTLRVSSQSPELGEAKEELPIESEASMKVGFNARYLIEILGVIDSEEISLDLNGDLAPGVIHPADDPLYTAVVMPVRI